jgi:hypothetical protein
MSAEELGTYTVNRYDGPHHKVNQHGALLKKRDLNGPYGAASRSGSVKIDIDKIIADGQAAGASQQKIDARISKTITHELGHTVMNNVTDHHQPYEEDGNPCAMRYIFWSQTPVNTFCTQRDECLGKIYVDDAGPQR